MNKIVCLLFLFVSFNAYGQKDFVPKNIEQAVTFLIKDCPDSLKRAIKSNKNDTLINLVAPYSQRYPSYQVLSEWTPSDQFKKNRLEKYYAKLGINIGKHIETIILISFKNYLNTGNTNHENVLKPFQEMEKKWNAEDKVRYTTDSLRGVYIPKDLNECFRLIDGFWSDSTKNAVSKMAEDNFVGGAHLGFGMWMRNNWQLWGGSRLTKYFNDKGVYHPESISCIILVSYQRYLKHIPIDLEGQVKKDQNFQKSTREPNKKMYPKGVVKLSFNSGFYYDSKKNGTGLIQVGTSPQNRDIWIYDYYFGWLKVSDEELSTLEKASMADREDVLNKIFNKTKN